MLLLLSCNTFDEEITKNYFGRVRWQLQLLILSCSCEFVLCKMYGDRRARTRLRASDRWLSTIMWHPTPTCARRTVALVKLADVHEGNQAFHRRMLNGESVKLRFNASVSTACFNSPGISSRLSFGRWRFVRSRQVCPLASRACNARLSYTSMTSRTPDIFAPLQKLTSRRMLF